MRFICFSIALLCFLQTLLAEEVRLLDLEPNDAHNIIESQDQTLRYAPKIDSNVPAVRYLGNEPHHVLEDIYLAKQYHGQDGIGGYLYGYSVPDIAKNEKKVAGGDLTGAYNYIAGDGQEIKVQYWDDGTGFHQVDNVPKILPKQIDDSPEVKAEKEKFIKRWQEEAERNQHPIASPYNNEGQYASGPLSPQGQLQRQQQFAQQQQYQQAQYPQQGSSAYPHTQQQPGQSGVGQYQSAATQSSGQYQQPSGQPSGQYQQTSGQSSGQYQQPSGQSSGQYQQVSGQSPGQYQQPSGQSSGQDQGSSVVPLNKQQQTYYPNLSGGDVQSSTETQPDQYQQSQSKFLSNLNQIDYSGQYSENKGVYARPGGEEEEETTGPPKGFFYSFDYPVGIIVQKEGALQKREGDLKDIYAANKAQYESQLQGGSPSPSSSSGYLYVKN